MLDSRKRRDDAGSILFTLFIAACDEMSRAVFFPSGAYPRVAPLMLAPLNSTDRTMARRRSRTSGP